MSQNLSNAVKAENKNNFKVCIYFGLHPYQQVLVLCQSCLDQKQKVVSRMVELHRNNMRNIYMKAVIKGPCYEILDFIFWKSNPPGSMRRRFFFNLQI